MKVVFHRIKLIALTGKDRIRNQNNQKPCVRIVRMLKRCMISSWGAQAKERHQVNRMGKERCTMEVRALIAFCAMRMMALASNRSLNLQL